MEQVSEISEGEEKASQPGVSGQGLGTSTSGAVTQLDTN